MQQELKFSIPDNAKNVLVFVHGLGVRYDSKGLFTDIQKSLPKNWGSALFDFYNFGGDDIFVTPIQDQIQRLKDVLEQLKLNYPQVKVDILAHSQGCMITSLLKPKVGGEVLFLAPPETIPPKNSPQKGPRFQERKVQNTEDGISVQRRNGSKLFIPKQFTEETLGTNVQELILEYSKEQPLSLVVATKDEALGKVEFKKLQNLPNVKIYQLPADHNFTNQSRLSLIKLVNQILTS